MTASVTTRVPKDMLEEIDRFSAEKHMDRATMLRNLIEQGLLDEKRKKVLLQYKNRKTSLQRAAEMLKIDLAEMIDIIGKEELHLDYSKEELRDCLLYTSPSPRD